MDIVLLLLLELYDVVDLLFVLVNVNEFVSIPPYDLNLYVECWHEYPKLQRFTDSKNNLYVDKWTWYLEWGNIKVKKSMWEF